MGKKSARNYSKKVQANPNGRVTKILEKLSLNSRPSDLMKKRAMKKKKTQDSGSLECPFCGKRTSRKERHEDHLRTHDGLRPYECKRILCGKRFKRKSHLVRHSLTHLEEKPFACEEENCGKTFTTKQRLQKHAEVHKKPIWQCQICEMVFVKESRLDFHLRFHTDLVYCPYSACKRKHFFPNADSYSKHVRLIHNAPTAHRKVKLEGGGAPKFRGSKLGSRRFVHKAVVKSDGKRERRVRLNKREEKCIKRERFSRRQRSSKRESRVKRKGARMTRPTIQQTEIIRYPCVRCAEPFFLKSALRTHEESGVCRPSRPFDLASHAESDATLRFSDRTMSVF